MKTRVNLRPFPGLWSLICLIVGLVTLLTSCFQVQMDLVFFKNMDGTVTFSYQIPQKYFDIAKIETNSNSALLPLEKSTIEESLLSFPGLALQNWQQTVDNGIVKTLFTIAFDNPEHVSPLLNNWDTSIEKQANGKYKFVQKLRQASIAAAESEKFAGFFKGMKLLTSLTSQTVHERTGDFQVGSSSSKSTFVLTEAEVFSSSAAKEWIIIY